MFGFIKYLLRELGEHVWYTFYGTPERAIITLLIVAVLAAIYRIYPGGKRNE